MKIDMKAEKNHAKFDGYLSRIDCTNEQGYYTVMFWDDYKETLTLSRHKTCNAGDRQFRKLMVDAQKKGSCCRILLVADDNCEVQRCELTSYN